jgi:PAS domain S-box-containing protein
MKLRRKILFWTIIVVAGVIVALWGLFYHLNTGESYGFEFNVLVSILLGLAAIVITLWLARILVLSKLAKLNREIDSILAGDDIYREVKVQGNDEFTELATGVNGLLQKLKEFQSESRQSEVKDRLLLNSFTSPIVALNKEGEVLFSNEAFARFCDKKPEELVAKLGKDCFPLLGDKTLTEALREVTANGKPLEMELGFEAKTYRCHIFHTPWGGLLQFQDITGIKAAERNLERHKRTIASLYEFSHEINKSRNMDELASAMVRLLSNNPGVLGVGFYMHSGPHRFFKLQSSYVAGSSSFGYVGELLLDDPLVDEVCKANGMWLADDLHKKQTFLCDIKPGSEENVLLFPLQSGNELVGILNMVLESYDRDTISFLEMIAREIGTGMKHKQAENSLRKSEMFVRSIVERSPIGISVRSKTGGLITYNEAWKRLWGKTDEDIMHDFSKSRNKLEFDESDGYLGPYQADVNRVYAKGGFCLIPELEIKSPRPGGANWLSQYFYSIEDASGEVEQVVILTIDITEHKRAELLQGMASRISEAVSTTDNLHELYPIIHQIIGSFIKVNNFVIALYDSATDMVEAPYYVDEHDAYFGPRTLGNSVIDHIIRTGKSVVWKPGEYEQVVTKLGLKPIGTPSASWLGVPLKTKNRLIGVVAVQSYRDDIVFGQTEKNVLEFASNQIALAIERKQAEEELKASLEFNQAVIEHSPLSITIRDKTGRLTTYNQTWLDMWNISAEDLDLNMQRNRPLDEILGFLGEWEDKVIDIYQQGGTLFIPEYHFPPTRTGSPEWVSYYFYAITDEQGDVLQVVNITEDISERKRSENLRMAAFQITESANSTDSLPELFTSIHHILDELIKAPNFFIALLDKKTNRVTFPYHVDEKDELPDPPYYELRNLKDVDEHGRKRGSLTDYILHNGETLFFNDGKVTQFLKKHNMVAHGTQAYAWLGVPLKIKNKVIGVMVCQSYTQDVNYHEDDLKILEFVSNQIAIAIERKIAEESLRSTDLLNRAVIENSPLAITVRRPDGRLVLYNNTWREMWRINEEELRENIDEIKPLEERFDFLGEWLPAVVKIYTEGGALFIPECTYMRERTELPRWVSYHFYAIQDTKGKVELVVNLTEDVTKRRESQHLQEATFRISEAANTSENLQELYAGIHQIMGEFINASNFFIALYDEIENEVTFPYAVDEGGPYHETRKLGHGFTDHVIKTGKTLLASKAELEGLRKKHGIEQIGTTAEYWLGVPLKTGEKTIGALVIQSYDKTQRLDENEKNILQFVSTQVAMAIERKQAEEALRASEEKFRQIAENINEVFWVRDFKTKELLYISPSYDVLTGYSSEGLYQDYEKYSLAIHPDDAKRVKQAVGKQYEDGYFNEEYRILRPDGTVRWVRDRTYPVNDETGEIVRLVGIAEDITSRKRAELIQNAVFKISEAAHTVPNLHDLYASIHRILGEIINAKNFYIAIYDEPTDTFYFPYHVDEVDETPAPRKMGKSITEYVFKTGVPLLAKPEEFDQIRREHGFKLQGSLSKYWLGVPLKTQDRNIGVLVVQSYSEDIIIDEVDKEVLQFVSTQVAMAIERKRAMEALRSSEEFNRAIVENSPLGIAVRNQQGRLLSYNETWKLMWDLGDKDVKRDIELGEEGKELKQRFGSIKEWDAEVSKIFSQGGNLFIPEVALENAKTEEPIWLSFYFYDIKDEEGNIDRIVTLTEDITERKKAEEKLRQVLEELEAANAQLKKVDQLKTEFLNMTSHELKTPLASILGYSELLAEGVLGEVHPNQEKALDGIVRNAQQLRKLVDELLETSRIESGTLKLVIEPVVMKDMLGDIMESMEAHAAENKVKLALDAPTKLPVLYCDVQRITQVLYNLIDNAIKFSPEDGTITIVAKPDKSEVLLGVQDQGVGIPPDEVDKVFERFYQVDMFDNRQKGGLGLGLAISKGIVEAHEGRIWVTSQIGKGSTFWFTLPLKEK